MRLVSYRASEGELRAGLVVGDNVVDLERAGRHLGLELPLDLLGILAREQDGVRSLERVAAAANTLETLPLEAVALGPVLPRPPKLLLLAGNYQSHITEGGAPPIKKAEITPRYFLKPGTAVIGTGQAGVAKIEAAGSGVSLDLMFRCLIAAGGTVDITVS